MHQPFVCPRCGTQNPSSQKFCGTCGAMLFTEKQQAYDPRQRYKCSKCGQEVIQDMKFCGDCGKPLNWTTQKEAQLPPVYQQERIQQLSAQVNEILTALQYGSEDDKFKAITLARKKVNENFLSVILDEKEIKQLVKQATAVKLFSPFEIQNIASGLREVLVNRNNLLLCWYTIIALVDYGDLSVQRLDDLLTISNQVISWLVQIGEKESGLTPLAAVVAEFEVQKETMRALSRFKSSPKVGEIIKECFEGRYLVGQQKMVLRESALYAFGALGNSDYRGLVEYWATRAENKDEKKAAGAALALWGQGDFDSIMKYAGKG